MGKTIHVAVKELPQTLRDALKEVGYGARDIGVTPQDAVEPNAYAGEGQKGFVVIVNLSTGKREVLGGDWGGGSANMKPIDSARQDVKIPEGGAVIIGTNGWPRTMASIYVHPDVIAKMLPAGAEVTEREKGILRAVRGLTSAGRKEEFERMRMKPEELDALVDRKLLSRNKAGAISITLAGKNVAEDRVRSILRRMEEAKQPYWQKQRDDQQMADAEMHDAIAAAARGVMKAATTLHQVVAKAADKTGEGTFLGTREHLEKVDVVEIMKQVAIEHTRWAKNIRDARLETV